MSEDQHCNVLVSKNSTAVVPVSIGWEGIPDGIAYNCSICIALLIGFAIIQWRVCMTKDRPKDKQNINWLHFIFGDKIPEQTESFVSKKINRKHSLDYLPQILHEYEYAITDQIGREKHDEKHDGLHIELKEKDEKVLSQEQKELELMNENPKDEDFKDEDPEEQKSLRTHNYSDTTHKDSQKADLNSKSLGKNNSKNKPKMIEKVLKPFLKYLTIKDKDILREKGKDALQYLIFQRYIIYFLTALTVICLTVVLPTNLHGSYEGDLKPFGSTTINNLHSGSQLYWIHAVMVSFIAFVGIFLMFDFYKLISITSNDYNRKVLLIQEIPKSKRRTQILVNYFKENFPNVVINRITFCYDIRVLESLKRQHTIAVNAKKYCLEYMQKYNSSCEVRPYALGRCGRVFGCCNCCPKIDGFRYYAQKIVKLEELIKKEVIKTLSNPKGSAFIRFNNQDMAHEVFDFFKRKRTFCCNCFWLTIQWLLHLSKGKNNDSLKTYEWKVYFAPIPEDIEWRDIAIEQRVSCLWNIGINIILLLIFIFLSTPAVAVKIIDNMFSLKTAREVNVMGLGFMNSILKYLSSLLLMLMTTVLPTLVTIAVSQSPNRTKSALNHAIMRKVYLFLMMMVFILPSLGLMSTDVLIQKLMAPNSTNTFKWNCLFPSESSAFFVNYVLAAGFVSNTFEMMRIPELVYYFVYISLISRSPAEIQNARQQISFEFFFGLKYPRFLLIFTIVTTYSIACPLIAPCGLFYMVGKHLVDRYCIYYVYTPSKINSDIHTTAIFYVHLSIILLLLQVSAFLAIRGGHTGPVLVTQIVLYLFITAICCRKCFNSTKRVLHKNNDLF